MSLPIIFDTDPGVDDAQAIALLFADPAFEVIGLTTTFGNVPVTTATRNALLLTELAGRDTPVAAGVAEPLVKPAGNHALHVHGQDGLGNQQLPAPSQTPHALDAARFIVEQTRLRPGEITLVAVGPLGNLALALALDPTVAERVRKVVVMGGAIVEPGNVTPVAEANIFSDPHAAARVFAAPWPLTLVGLDATHRAVLDPPRLQRIAARQGALGEVLARSYDFYADFYRSVKDIDGCHPHDSCALAYLRRPELFHTARGHLSVGTEGLAEGQTFFAPEGRAYLDGRWSGNPLVTVCLGMDGPAMVAWMEEVLTAAER